MKKTFLNLFTVSFLTTSLILSSCSKEESKSTETPTPSVPQETFMASTNPQNRAALLEDFTGVRCGFCPDGHVRANQAQESLGKDKFIIIAVHGGSYAAPATGWANFTTPFGAALISQSSVTGYPAGTISRIEAEVLGVPPQKAGGLAMSRGSWSAAASAVNGLSAPVNIGSKATFNAETRELTVNVDLYYTADQLIDSNNINVAFLQSNLMSKQSGDPTPNDPYQQNHVLRHLITGQFGEAVATTRTKGTKYSKTYTYKVPADYNGTATEGGGAVKIDDCSIVVFVTKGKTEVLNAIELDIK
jgi:hypothetical protein